MTTTEAYDKFIIRSEKNGTNDNVAVDSGRFVELLYSAYLRYIDYIFEHKNDDDMLLLQPLLVSNRVLKIKRFEGYYEGEFPNNTLHPSSIKVEAKKGNCRADIEEYYHMKDFNKSIVLNDGNTRPSFKFRSLPYLFSENSVEVYNGEEFDISKISMSYYRLPKKPRLKYEDDPESGFDDTFPLDLSDNVIDRIISLAVGEFDLNTHNPRATANLQRAISKV